MSKSLKKVLIGLGANLGEAKKTLEAALEAIEHIEGVTLKKQSAFYKTAPVDSSGPDYINAVALLETSLSPESLLRELQAIENDYGRVRPAGVHNAPRTLDLDILIYEGLEQQVESLTLPHPRMMDRLFVLVPWLEVEDVAQLGSKTRLEQKIAQLKQDDPSQIIEKLIKR